MLSGALEAPDTSNADAMVQRKFLGMALPHGVVAVEAAPGLGSVGGVAGADKGFLAHVGARS